MYIPIENIIGSSAFLAETTCRLSNIMARTECLHRVAIVRFKKIPVSCLIKIFASYPVMAHSHYSWRGLAFTGFVNCCCEVFGDSQSIAHFMLPPALEEDSNKHLPSWIFMHYLYGHLPTLFNGQLREQNESPKCK